jgi:rubrerythrin
MHSLTASNLRNAHGCEAMARMRYEIWGDIAQKEGFPNVARLFRAIAAAEAVHASSHFEELEAEKGDYLCASMATFGSGSTSQNLAGGIAGETYEITEMYPAYLEIAKSQEERGAQRSFNSALEGEKTHLGLYRKAKQAVDSLHQDLKLGPVQVCLACGRTSEGEIPERCPTCLAPREHFRTFSP